MLSTATHHYTAAFGVSGTEIAMYSSGISASDRIQTSAIDSLAQESQYALQQIQQMSMPNQHPGPAIRSPTRTRHHPYENAHARNRDGRRKNSEAQSDSKNQAGGPVRRRISRACDQCNQLRTKCDGRNPCAHCVGKDIIKSRACISLPVTNDCLEFGLACEYFRERKKRGKASRKDLQQQQNAGSSASGNPQSPSDYSSEGPSPTQEQFGSFDGPKVDPRGVPEIRPPTTRRRTRTMSMSGNIGEEGHSVNGSQQMIPGNGEMMNEMPVAGPIMQQPQQQQHHHGMPSIPDNTAVNIHVSRGPMGDSPTPISLNGFGLMQGYRPPGLHVIEPMTGTSAIHHAPPIQQVQPAMGPQGAYGGYDGQYPLMSPHDLHPPQAQYPFARHNDSPLPNFMTGSPVAGSSWLAVSTLAFCQCPVSASSHAESSAEHAQVSSIAMPCSSYTGHPSHVPCLRSP